MTGDLNKGFKHNLPHHETKYDNHKLDEENKKVLQLIEDITMNADEVQNKVLIEILNQNANIEYLKRHGFRNGEPTSDYKKVIPIISYEDIVTDIHRIANGDTSSILSSQPILEFLTSSGTSGGERKLIPITEKDAIIRSNARSMFMPIMSQFVPGLEKGKGMTFMFIKSASKTPGGQLAQPLLTKFYKSKHFQDRPFHPYTNYTTPNEAIVCLDIEQSMYVQLLCGLCESKEVIWIGAAFALIIIRVIKLLENNWEVLCQDIRTGSLNARVTDPDIKDAVAHIIKPNPSLAEVIEAECQKGTFRGIIRRLWPNVKFIATILTGTMAQYRGTLEYYSDGISLVSPIYGSSECYFGMNLDPFCTEGEVAYTCFPHLAYFEFMPVMEDGNVGKGELVDLVDVKLGQQYELIITNYSGLFRYRVGDILRVVGFKNKSPQFTFVCRKNVCISVDAEKTSEIELQRAVKKAANHLSVHNASLVDYTSYVDTKTLPGHYVLFWEITQNDHDPDPTHVIPASLFEDCCFTIEESLNAVYRQYRASDKTIGPLEIRLLINGSFDEVMDYSIARGASINQYKTPRSLQYGPIVELFNSKVVSCYFSKKCPAWIPGHYRISN